MNYKLCELYNKYTILSKYEQNNNSFKWLLVCLLFHCFRMSQVRENEISLCNSSRGPVYLRTLEQRFLTMFLPQHPFWSRLSSPPPPTIG